MKKGKQKLCPDCPSHTLEEIPFDVMSSILDKKKELKMERKPASIPKSVYRIIREWQLFKKSKPAIQLTNDDDFVIVIPIDERKKIELLNAINKKTSI